MHRFNDKFLKFSGEDASRPPFWVGATVPMSRLHLRPHSITLASPLSVDIVRLNTVFKKPDP